MLAIGLARSQPLGELLLAAIALAVSAIPEGLPVSLTVALAVAVSRMARRKVVVRHLPAVEGLGSCGVIATDKTGTLTRNELTVERVEAAGLCCDVSGVGYAPEGELRAAGRAIVLGEQPRLARLLRAACLTNEASLVRAAGADGWQWSGDPTDIALLALGAKAGCDAVALREAHPLLTAIPFEPERRYSASFHRSGEQGLVCVKGAPERVLEMCRAQASEDGASERPLETQRILARLEQLMRQGYRVLAIADAQTPGAVAPGDVQEPEQLVFLGLVAMTDPPRAGVPDAIARCQRAGIRVVMVTGDHATTARAIAQRIGLCTADAPLLTGSQIAGLDDRALSASVEPVAVIARATPTDKLRVVRAWQRRGALVAVTGDGVNDAPALLQADLGVAMGRAGTDVAREAADLVILDDDFSSIVAGVEEGRVAYDNLRKATYLLVSTGAGEVLLVTGALALGFPLPLTAVQLLWLNLVTNGIQDVALVFEPGEPGVLERPPRPAHERVFDRIMIERTLLAAAVFSGVGLAALWAWLASGRSVPEVRNLMVQLFVLFEIFHIGNARSESLSLLSLNPLRNPMLFVGTLAALALHATALHSPLLQGLLGIAPLAAREWALLAALASPIVLVLELHKRWRAPALLPGPPPLR
jgi:magnesium-transporting ATPase (P-type)